jgi:hypothetical protein
LFKKSSKFLLAALLKNSYGIYSKGMAKRKAPGLHNTCRSLYVYEPDAFELIMTTNLFYG